MNQLKNAVETIGKKKPLTNLQTTLAQKENAATSAKVNGVKDIETVQNALSDLSAALAARHPIIFLHWGAVG